jgi:hypothetical protein
VGMKYGTRSEESTGNNKVEKERKKEVIPRK